MALALPNNETLTRTQDNGGASRRRKRWDHARTVWNLGDWMARTETDGWSAVPFRRTAACGRAVTAETGRVQIRATGEACYASGVLVCGSVWNCPTCAAKIKTRRSLEVSLAASRHVHSGGVVGILTLTLRHSSTDDIGDLVDGLNAAWRSLQQGERWRNVRRPVVGVETSWSRKARRHFTRKVRSLEARIHTVKSLEVTRGANGWHPHLHVLILADDEEALAAVEACARTEWRHRVRLQLGSGAEPDEAHGVNMLRAGTSSKSAEMIAKYVAKYSLEVTRSDVKGADALASLLTDVATGDVTAVAAYIRWATAMKGKRAIVFSRGLRDELLPDVEELTDEELAAVEEAGRVVAEIPRADWLEICRAGRVALVLEQLESGDIPDRWRPPADATPAPISRWQRRALDRQTVGCTRIDT